MIYMNWTARWFINCLTELLIRTTLYLSVLGVVVFVQDPEEGVEVEGHGLLGLLLPRLHQQVSPTVVSNRLKQM